MHAHRKDCDVIVGVLCACVSVSVCKSLGSYRSDHRHTLFPPILEHAIFFFTRRQSPMDGKYVICKCRANSRAQVYSKWHEKCSYPNRIDNRWENEKSRSKRSRTHLSGRRQKAMSCISIEQLFPTNGEYFRITTWMTYDNVSASLARIGQRYIAGDVDIGCAAIGIHFSAII